jgi:hypothetical protein
MADSLLASSLPIASEPNPAPPSDVFTDPDDFRWEPAPAPVEAAPPAAVTRSPLPTWDEAIDAYIAEGDEPLQSLNALAQSPAVAIEPAVSPLESALLAGAAVVLWGAWEVQSRKDHRRRLHWRRIGL